ncbi:MAG: SH3 domain-containing protein [Clostridia bacterium]|nr:SH3 domain-containing protein [Clostridia bacterium]
MKRIGWIALALCLLVSGGAAQSVPLTDYAPGQMIDAGLHEPVAFLSGCVLESGEGFMLVNTSENGAYLLRATGRLARDTISIFIPMPKGYSAEVTARDESGCVVRIWNAQESLSYTYAYEPGEKYEEPWKLRAFARSSAEGEFSVQLSLDRAQATLASGSGVEQYTTFYQFYVEANNINYDKIPRSMADLKRLEKEYPVAAVSPDDSKTRVNLRKGPSSKTERVGSLYSGARLRIREIEDGWAKIHVGDMDAYISTEFLTFGAAIEQVADARPMAVLKDAQWVETSRMPYRGGGGTVSRTQGGQQVRIIGEYNNAWRIVGDGAHSYFIHDDNLQ